MKMKCTQCGCTDLVKTFWPHEYKLETVSIGFSGESYEYALREAEHADVYICTQCGHFEFFNKKLADQILESRKAIAEISRKMNEADKIIDRLNNENTEYENSISRCNEELQNLDITVRRSNELKENIKSLQNEIQKVKQEIRQTQLEKDELEKKLKDFK